MTIVYDNCMYRLGTDFEHIGQEYQNDNYQTINWMHTMLPSTFDDDIRQEYREKGGRFRDLGSWRRVVEVLIDEAKHEDYREACWSHFIGLADANGAWSLLSHPNYDPGMATPFVYQKHVDTTTGTAAYSDNEAVLERALNLLWTKFGRELAFVFGDQQSFSRMVNLWRDNPEKYGWLIPFPGDFHFLVHALMGIHSLFWPTLIRWLVQDVGLCRRSCNEKHWSSVEKYNNYRPMYETFIVAIVQYLQSFLPSWLLSDYPRLKDLAKGNAGATALLVFLYEFALPWLSLRQSIRSNSTENIETMWNLTLPWFRATGKTNYDKLCVDHALILVSLLPSLRKLYRLTRTASLRGNVGRNVALDQALEQMNNEIKNLLADNAKRDGIDGLIVILNGLRQVEEKLSAALGVDPDDLEDVISVRKQDDVEQIVEALKAKLPPSDFFEPSSVNPFGAGKPWEDVQKARRGIKTFVEDHCSRTSQMT